MDSLNIAAFNCSMPFKTLKASGDEKGILSASPQTDGLTKYKHMLLLGDIEIQHSTTNNAMHKANIFTESTESTIETKAIQTEKDSTYFDHRHIRFK